MADGQTFLALDLISTLNIEELLHEIKKKYTIIIVTNDMQQAGLVSDLTSFFNADTNGKGDKIGYLVENASTKSIFQNLKEQATQDYVSECFS